MDSPGFPYHAYPYDFWRYEKEDMQNVFSDCDILALEKDPQEPGVFIKARKPSAFVENNLSDYKLYSIVTNKRTKEITKNAFINMYFIRLLIKRFIHKVLSWISSRF